jgi:hypothetical protein
MRLASATISSERLFSRLGAIGYCTGRAWSKNSSSPALPHRAARICYVVDEGMETGLLNGEALARRRSLWLCLIESETGACATFSPPSPCPTIGRPCVRAGRPYYLGLKSRISGLATGSGSLGLMILMILRTPLPPMSRADSVATQLPLRSLGINRGRVK